MLDIFEEDQPHASVTAGHAYFDGEGSRAEIPWHNGPLEVQGHALVGRSLSCSLGLPGTCSRTPIDNRRRRRSWPRSGGTRQSQGNNGPDADRRLPLVGGLFS
jgi:hypothetical protein